MNCCWTTSQSQKFFLQLSQCNHFDVHRIQAVFPFHWLCPFYSLRNPSVPKWSSCGQHKHCFSLAEQYKAGLSGGRLWLWESYCRLRFNINGLKESFDAFGLLLVFTQCHTHAVYFACRLFGSFCKEVALWSDCSMAVGRASAFHGYSSDKSYKATGRVTFPLEQGQFISLSLSALKHFER